MNESLSNGHIVDKLNYKSKISYLEKDLAESYECNVRQSKKIEKLKKENDRLKAEIDKCNHSVYYRQ
jgi:cell division protein FtsB